MMQTFGISQITQRNEEMLREVRANRIEKKLRQNRVDRASPLSALRERIGRSAASSLEEPAQATNV